MQGALNVTRCTAWRTVAVALLVVALITGAIATVRTINRKPAGGSPTGVKPSPTSASAPRIHGWITASASGITDQSGKRIRLLGVGDGRMNQCKPSVPGQTEAATLQRLGFNSVRLSISWAATEPTPPIRRADGSWEHHWDSAYLHQVDQAVSVFRAHGIAVILDMHQVKLSSAVGGNPCSNVYLPPWLFAGQQSREQAVCDLFTDTAAPKASIRPYEALSAVWQHYAARYAANPSVIAADVYNEPNVVDACPNVLRERLVRFYGVVGAAIRKANPKMALILEDVAYEGYQRVGLQLTGLPRLDNVIYSWHFYPTSWESGMPRLADHLAHARALGAPLWLGEFDAFGASSNTGRRANANWRRDLAAMMSYCRDNDIGWSLWEYRGAGSSLIDRVTGLPKQPLAQSLQAGF
jgi:hypothetical protein